MTAIWMFLHAFPSYVKLPQTAKIVNFRCVQYFECCVYRTGTKLGSGPSIDVFQIWWWLWLIEIFFIIRYNLLYGLFALTSITIQLFLLKCLSSSILNLICKSDQVTVVGSSFSWFQSAGLLQTFLTSEPVWFILA